MTSPLSVNIFKSFKEPNILLRKKTKKLLKKNKKKVIKSIGKKKYSNYVKHGVIPRNLKIYVGDKAIKAENLHKHFKSQIAVHAPFREDKTPSAMYYPDSNTVYDHATSTRYTIKSKKTVTKSNDTTHKIVGKYIDSSVIKDEDGVALVLAPTASGKTYFIRNVLGTKILLVPTRAIAENLHSPQDNIHYIEASEHSLFSESLYTSDMQEDCVNVMTFEKFLASQDDISQDAKIYVDEAHHLISKFRADTVSKLEIAFKKFKRITFLSATMNPKFILNLDKIYRFTREDVLNITIVKNQDMNQYMNDDEALHVIFNQDSYKNIEAHKKYKDSSLCVYSNHLEDMQNPHISDNIKYIFATSAMAEGVSLFVSEGRKVIVHITKAFASAEVIQMAARIRNADMKVYIHTTMDSYKKGTKSIHQFDKKELEKELQELLSLWDTKKPKKLERYKLIYKSIENQFASSIKDDSYSMFNLMSSYRAFEEQNERAYLGNFIKGLKEFSKVEVKVIKPSVKKNIGEDKRSFFDEFGKPEDGFENVKELQKESSKFERSEELSKMQLTQLERYSNIMHETISDVEIMDLISSDTKLSRYLRSIELKERGVYKLLNKLELYRKCKVGDTLSNTQIRNMTSYLHKHAVELKLTRYRYKAIELLKQVMLVQKVRGKPLYRVLSKTLHKPP